MLISGEHAFTRLWDNYCSLLLSLNINNLTRRRVGGGDNGVWQWVAWVTDQPLHVQISLKQPIEPTFNPAKWCHRGAPPNNTSAHPNKSIINTKKSIRWIVISSTIIQPGSESATTHYCLSPLEGLNLGTGVSIQNVGVEGCDQGRDGKDWLEIQPHSNVNATSFPGNSASFPCQFIKANLHKSQADPLNPPSSCCPISEAVSVSSEAVNSLAPFQVVISIGGIASLV